MRVKLPSLTLGKARSAEGGVKNLTVQFDYFILLGRVCVVAIYSSGRCPRQISLALTGCCLYPLPFNPLPLSL